MASPANTYTVFYNAHSAALYCGNGLHTTHDMTLTDMEYITESVFRRSPLADLRTHELPEDYLGPFPIHAFPPCICCEVLPKAVSNFCLETEEHVGVKKDIDQALDNWAENVKIEKAAAPAPVKKDKPKKPKKVVKIKTEPVMATDVNLHNEVDDADSDND